MITDQIKVVIVDDEPRIRQGLEKLIKKFRPNWHICGVFSDGDEAFREIHEKIGAFDLIFTDVQMPVINGLELISLLKEKGYNFYSIIISGYDDFKYVQTALREGAIDYILKPIDRENFESHLQKAEELIVTDKKNKRLIEEAEEIQTKLTYEKQIQLLSDTTAVENMDVSYLDWTRDFPDGKYNLLYIGIDNAFSRNGFENKDEWKKWDVTIKESIRKSFIKERNWIWKNNQYSYWVLIYNGEEAKIEQSCLSLKTTIQRTTPFTASIALGQPFVDLSMLVDVKNELREAMKYRMIQGGNKLFKTESLKLLTYNKITDVPPAVYKWAEQTVEAMKYEEQNALTAINSFFDELKKMTSPFLLQESVRYLCIRVINQWIQDDGISELPTLLSEAFSITDEPASFSVLRQEMINWIMKIRKMRENYRKNTIDPIVKAKEWIHSNLGENITIKRIAEHVHLNPTYFCEYFKNQTGETVLDYVTNARIQKAKQLLAATEMKIYDIAVHVGYQDAKYFSRLFKQWTGLLPSQYREKRGSF